MRAIRVGRFVAAAALAVSLTGCGAGSYEPTTTPLSQLRDQSIAWHDCRTGPDDELGNRLAAAGARCGEFRVPLSYADPAGPTITIAVARRAATDTAHRLGTLLVQTGGPGPSRDGVTMIVDGPAGGYPATELAQRYDLVGMDPRFFGASTPLECGWPTGTYLGLAQTAPANRADFDRTVDAANELAARCAPNRAVLPHASTRNVARDMDLLRTLLHESTVSYLGWSWGTYLGAVYLQMFGDHLDRVVLDSALDPRAPGPDLTRDTAQADAAALADWAQWASRRDAEFGVGTTADGVLHTIDGIVGSVAGRPVSLGPVTITADMIPGLLLTVDDSDASYTELGQQVRVLRDASAGAEVDLTPDLARKLALYADTTTAPEFGFSATVANQCADRRARAAEAYFADIESHRNAEPMFGALARHLTPCAVWPVGPAEAATEIDNRLPALLVGASGDPVAPAAGQRAMRQALSGARSITLADTFRHGVYLMAGVRCVDSAVERYLLGGSLPADDATCQRDQG